MQRNTDNSAIAHLILNLTLHTIAECQKPGFFLSFTVNDNIHNRNPVS
ncbi:hypothetical protein [Planktothricoides sp. SR001]|nr:hypothetical protein [Planktothricoides sp. SR001]